MNGFIYVEIMKLYFTINKAELGDLPFIHELNQHALPAVSSVTEKELTHFLTISDYFNIIKTNNKFVGFLIALTPGKDYASPNYKWFEKHYTQFMYVDRIVINPTFHGQGLGQAFYHNLIKFSRQISPIITCEVNLKPKNEGSLIFHEKFGFKQVGTQETDGGKKEVSLMIFQIP